MLRRTVYAARYLAEDYRRKISRQLNKAESMHGLRRDAFYAHDGAVRGPRSTSAGPPPSCVATAATSTTRSLPTSPRRRTRARPVRHHPRRRRR
ncbi:MAG TPA: Tn3 family transposase [Pseudonocardia sp.]|uniref:Tn3 family transposase n=1 Tax=Pseudonocardia sp. TaxID=60912 RepID=UPI002EDB135C